MKPRPVTDWDARTFSGVKFTYKCPPDMPNCEPLEVVRSTNPQTLRIPFVSDDRDNPKFEGTVWVTIWGWNMPPIDGYVFPSSTGLQE